ncbi:MAG: hypothetical protein COV67_04100, partial [Nitrospinae bacterium CG11_big_fil_rev_8_21_14_0_20_56_8]
MAGAEGIPATGMVRKLGTDWNPGPGKENPFLPPVVYLALFAPCGGWAVEPIFTGEAAKGAHAGAKNVSPLLYPFFTPGPMSW